MALPPHLPTVLLPASAVDLWHRVRVWRSFAFLGLGAVWDILTLTRIDRWSDQAFIFSYQIVFFVTLVLDMRWRETGRGPALLHRFPNLYLYVSQLALGSLLSAYCVYYFRGAASLRMVLYGGLLAVLLIANEFVADRVRGAQLRLAVLAFALFNGFIFAVPILSGWLVPPWVAAGLALGATALAGWLSIASERSVLQQASRLRIAVVALVVTLGLVSLNVLPPLPLSLHRVGVFRDLRATDAGIAVTYETSTSLIPWRYDRLLHWQPGETAWCFTAVFVPRAMKLTLTHEWQKYDPQAGWVTTDLLPVEISGGRDAGYRTFSRKQALSEGSWRVRIADERQRELGQIRFTVIQGAPTQPLQQTVH